MEHGGFGAIAVLLAIRGYAVIPVSRSKVPVIRSPHRRGHRCRGECGAWGHGVHDATTDLGTIGAWAAAYPWAQPAVACGASGLVVIDVDSLGGEATLARLGPVPDTFEVATGRGRHLWYACDLPGLRTRALPGLDVKAGPAYVLAPGAVNRSGATYRVARQLPVAPAPDWLLALCLGTAPVQLGAEQLQRPVVPAA